MNDKKFTNIKISTTNCGIKYKNRDDLLLIFFPNKANVAGVFTKSSMPAAPIVWCKKNIIGKSAKALVVNAGNANAFTGKEGENAVFQTANKVAQELGCLPQEVFISSTGVIGEPLKVDLITSAIPAMIKNFHTDDESWNKAAHAIMTTDTKAKIVKKICKINNQEVSLIGFAKGSGMIAPNMATMLAYIFTDANITSEALEIILKNATEQSFNSITVDSDQSTNDTVLFFATKEIGDVEIGNPDSVDLVDFTKAVNQLALELAKMIVIDGEGAKKLIEIEVLKASNEQEAKTVAFAIANSPLVKTAIAGADPNWGRIVMAVGKSCSNAFPEKLKINIGKYSLVKDGAKHPDYIERDVHEYLKNNEIKISVSLENGLSKATVWTCDLNEEYIKINKDYRS